MKNIIYVYGTLRPGGTETFQIPGKMYAVSWFPGIILLPEGGPEDSYVTCERIEVSDLAHVDAYEGFYPDDLRSSLYIRKPIFDGWIYEYNYPVSQRDLIPSGDWLVYKNEERGANGKLFAS